MYYFILIYYPYIHVLYVDKLSDLGVCCQTVMSVRRSRTSAVTASASTLRAASAVCATTASRPRRTRPCAWVSVCRAALFRCLLLWITAESHCLWQISTSASGSRVETAPVKTPWAPTTACASPASSSRTTTTAWVRKQLLYTCP